MDEDIFAQETALKIPKQYMLLFLAIVLLINLIAFVLMGIDKQKARKRKRRISEKTLLSLAVIGGSVGIFLGMTVFHHKTSALRHRVFVIGVPVILLVQLIVCLIVFSTLI